MGKSAARFLHLKGLDLDIAILVIIIIATASTTWALIEASSTREEGRAQKDEQARLLHKSAELTRTVGDLQKRLQTLESGLRME